MRLFRLFKILYVLLRYRLDTLLFANTRAAWLSQLLNGLFFWQHPLKPRGERLRLALEALGPIFVKFGQVLSTRRDLISADIADELAKLQDQVPPVDYASIETTIQAAFNQPIQQIFSHFEAQAVASASVAQVHFAVLANGQEVAVKVLRPNISAIIHQDLKLLDSVAWLAQAASREAKKLKPCELVAEFARHTECELDLTLEAANCSLLGRNFANSARSNARLLVPQVYWDWCRKEVMVMERMLGTPIRERETLVQKGIDISRLASEGVEIFFTQVFRDGFFHADMHPGNIQVDDSGKYIALDFGIMGTLNDTDKYYLARNFLAFFNQDYRDIAQAHIESGWVPKDTKREELETAVRAICEPIFNKPLKDISFARTLLSLFQMARRFDVIIQPQLIMLQKTLLNIEGLGRELDPELDLWKSAQPFLTRWMSEQMGWRSVAQTLKNELPFILKKLPEMPRLMHTYLSQQTQNEQENALHQAMHKLAGLQSQQTRWQKRLLWGIVLFVLLQAAYVWFYWR